MLSEAHLPSRPWHEIAPLYRRASKICSGFQNRNKLVDALDALGTEEKPYALVYLDGHIERATSIIQKSREIQGQYHQLINNLGLEYPQRHILLEVAAQLINEGYQINVYFDCKQSVQEPRFINYTVSKHKNRSSSYVSMHFKPWDDCMHIYPDEVTHLLIN